MRCELCGKMFLKDDMIPGGRFCFDCAIAACEKQLAAGKRCRFYPDQPTDCTIETCEYAKENGVKRKEDCENWRGGGE